MISHVNSLAMGKDGLRQGPSFRRRCTALFLIAIVCSMEIMGLVPTAAGQAVPSRKCTAGLVPTATRPAVPSRTAAGCPRCPVGVSSQDAVTFIVDGLMKNPCAGKRPGNYAIVQSKTAYYSCLNSTDGSSNSIRIECDIFQVYNPVLKTCVDDESARRAAPAWPVIQMTPGDTKLRCSSMNQLLDAYFKGARQIVAAQRQHTNTTHRMLVTIVTASRGKYNKSGGFDCGAYADVQVKLPISYFNVNGKQVTASAADFRLTISQSVCNSTKPTPAPGQDISKRPNCTLGVHMPPVMGFAAPFIQQYFGSGNRRRADTAPNGGSLLGTPPDVACSVMTTSAAVTAGVICAVAACVSFGIGGAICAVIAGGVIGGAAACFSQPKKVVSCFPAGAQVARQDPASGAVKHVPIFMIKEGDHVAAITSSGHRVYAEVIHFTHRDPAKVDEFVEISTDANATLRLTPDHMLPVGPAKTMARSGTVRPGSMVWVWDEVAQAVVQSEVTAVRIVEDTGIFNPWVRGGTILVDSVVASCYSVFPEVVPEPVQPYVPSVFEFGVSSLGVGKLRKIGQAVNAVGSISRRILQGLV